MPRVFVECGCSHATLAIYERKNADRDLYLFKLCDDCLKNGGIFYRSPQWNHLWDPAIPLPKTRQKSAPRRSITAPRYLGAAYRAGRR